MTMTNNLLAMNYALAEKKISFAQYQNIRLGFMIFGAITFFLGMILLAIERVRLETTTNDTISWLAYGFNVLLTVGAAFVSASALHYFGSRNSEVKRIKSIDAELYQIAQDKINLLEDFQDEAPVIATVKPTNPVSDNGHNSLVDDSGNSARIDNRN
jgi:hypothetical protein